MPALLVQLQQTVYKMSDNLNGLVREFKLESNTPFTAYLYDTYFSGDKTIARIDVVFSGDPDSSETIKAVTRVKEAVAKDIESSPLAGVPIMWEARARTRRYYANQRCRFW